MQTKISEESVLVLLVLHDALLILLQIIYIIPSSTFALHIVKP